MLKLKTHPKVEEVDVLSMCVRMHVELDQAEVAKVTRRSENELAKAALPIIREAIYDTIQSRSAGDQIPIEFSESPEKEVVADG